LQGTIEKFERLVKRLVQANSCIRRKHSICHPYEQRIAETLPQSPQSMANGRLGQTEAVTRGSQATKIPNREEDAQ